VKKEKHFGKRIRQLNHHISQQRRAISPKAIDAVFISTADFQHAIHTIEAVQAGCDTYTEKPLAETMDDARAVLKAVKALVKSYKLVLNVVVVKTTSQQKIISSQVSLVTSKW
jgi:hypothetical protein